MREYETTFILQPEISEEGVAALRERMDGLLERNSATPLLFDDEGRRRLAYEIRNFQKGRYVTLNFLDEGQAIPELERALRLDDSVLRFLTVQVTEEVADIEARKVEAAEQARIREQKAAERAEREAAEASERAAREEAAEAARREDERARAAAAEAENSEAAADDSAADVEATEADSEAAKVEPETQPKESADAAAEPEKGAGE